MLLLGENLYKDSQYREAIKYFKKALDLSSISEEGSLTTVKVYSYLGMSYNSIY